VAHRKRAGSRGAAALDLSPSGAPKASTPTVPHSPVRAVRASPVNRSQEHERLCVRRWLTSADQAVGCEAACGQNVRAPHASERTACSIGRGQGCRGLAERREELLVSWVLSDEVLTFRGDGVGPRCRRPPVRTKSFEVSRGGVGSRCRCPLVRTGFGIGVLVCG
jgi:hypothetical protein